MSEDYQGNGWSGKSNFMFRSCVSDAAFGGNEKKAPKISEQKLTHKTDQILQTKHLNLSDFSSSLFRSLSHI
jgi:hypothetical protein